MVIMANPLIAFYGSGRSTVDDEAFFGDLRMSPFSLQLYICIV